MRSLLLITIMLLSLSKVCCQQRPPSSANDEEMLAYYAACVHTEPNMVPAEVLSVFRGAVQWLNDFYPGDAAVNAPHVCFVLGEDARDLGWSFNMYQAANALRSCFGVVWVVEGNIAPAETTETVAALVRKHDCRLVVLSRLAPLEAVQELTAVYPDVLFLTTSSSTDLSPLRNVRQTAVHMYEGAYLVGYLVQAITPAAVSDVGLIGGFQTADEYQSVNAYRFGMMDAARAYEQTLKRLVFWWTDTFNDADLAVYAMRDIAQRFNVSLVSQTIEPFDGQEWLSEHGLLGTGAIGDQGRYLESVVASMEVRWDVLVLHAYGLTLTRGNGSAWGDTAPLINSSVWLGSVGYGTLESFVPLSVQADLRSIRAAMAESPSASQLIWCGERVAALLPPGEQLDSATGCLTTAQQASMGRLHPDIEALGTYVIPLEVITLPIGSKVGMSVMVGVGLVFVLFVVVMCAVFRNAAVIYLQSARLTIASLLFATMSLVGLVLWIPDRTNDLCKASVAVYALGVYGMLSFFLTKAYGFFLIKHYSNKLVARPVTLRQTAWTFLLSYLVAVVLVFCWLFIDNEGATLLTAEDTSELDKYQVRMVCTTSSASEGLLWAMLGYALFMMLLVLVVCYRLSSRALGIWKDEMRYAFMMSWMLMMAAGLGVLTTLTITDNEDARQWLLFLAGYLAVLGAVLTFYGPKMWVLVFRRDSSKCGSVHEYTRRHRVYRSASSSGSGGPSRTTGSSAKRTTPGSGTDSSVINVSAAHASSIAL
jgi:basic membrane lipoprotein Med (substrate-binding protein (PBP1-ABC) superfamily)